MVWASYGAGHIVFFLKKEIYDNVGIVDSRLSIFEKIDMCEGIDEDL
jgi:hypothetical protein